MKKKILLIDGTNLFCRNFAAIPSIDQTGEHNGAIFGCLQSLLSLWKKFESDRIFFIFDGYGGSIRRRKIYENYKEKKTGVHIQTKFLFIDPEQQRKSFSRQILILKDILKKTPVDLMTVDYVEADDVIAYLASCNTDNEITIVSTDRDYLQLINGDLCKVFSPTKKIMYDENKTLEEFGVYPTNFTLYKCFMGDKSDNIDGLTDFGPKTLLKTFPFLSENKKYTLEDCFEYCEQQLKLPKPNKWYKIILDEKDRFEMNYKLMDLINLDISLSITSDILEKWNSPQKKINEISMFEFRNFLMLNRFNELLSRFEIYGKMVNKMTIK